MKEEIDCPRHPPTKRRHLERALDRHLAIWATDSRLSEKERNLAQGERDRRKKLRPEHQVGVIVGFGGASPEQVKSLKMLLPLEHPTEVHHPFCSKVVHAACKVEGARIVVDDDPRMATDMDVMYGLPSEHSLQDRRDQQLWKALRLSKDRGVNVKIIWPSGQVHEGRW